MSRLRVYTVPNCIDCAAVMHLLSEAGFEYDEIDISALPNAREALSLLSGYMSVPQVFFHNVFLGQVAQIRHLVQTGRLQQMIDEDSKHKREEK